MKRFWAKIAVRVIAQPVVGHIEDAQANAKYQQSQRELLADLQQRKEAWLNAYHQPDGAHALQGQDLSHLPLQGVDLSGADLAQTNLKWADLTDANLSRANLQGANLRDAKLGRANLAETSLVGADVHGANLNETNLFYADARQADFAHARFTKVDLSSTNLQEAKFEKAGFVGVAFPKTQMTKEQLECANIFEKCSFAGMDLREISWQKATLDRCDFKGADMSGSDLRVEFMFSSDFVGAKMQRVNLQGVKVQGDFRHTDLSYADLRNCEIFRMLTVADTNLSYANMAGAISRRVFSSGIIDDALERPLLTGAIMPDGTTHP